MKKAYHIIRLLTHEENLDLKWCPSGTKIGINAFIREGLCGGGAYTWSNKSVEEKEGLSSGGLYAGGGGGGGGACKWRNKVMKYKNYIYLKTEFCTHVHG